MAPKARIGTISGTFTAPGVSRNGRLYTKEMIGAGVADLQRRLAEGSDDAVVIYTSHESEWNDDPLHIVGRPTRVWQDDKTGEGKYEAEIPDTRAGRDMLALAQNGYAPTVSTRARWVGEVRKVTDEAYGDGEVETADGVEYLGWDFTNTPGVPRSRHDLVVATESKRTKEARKRGLLLESFEAPEVVVEDMGTPIDPDGDGDVDAVKCPSCGAVVSVPTSAANPDAAEDAGQESAKEQRPMEETAPEAPATEAVAKPTLTEADIKAIASAVAEQIKPAAEPVAETTTETVAQTESFDAAFAKAFAAVKEEWKAELRAEMVQEGLPARKGLVATGDAASKPLHEMSQEEFADYRREVAQAFVHPEVQSLTGA